MASRATYIDHLYKGRHSKKLVFRVIRLWNSYNTKRENDLISMDFVALDEKTQAIHCSIRSRFVPDFHGLISEGSIYSMKNFVVDVARPTFRVVSRDMFILLDASTNLEEIITNMPHIQRHWFNLIPFGDLEMISSQRKNLCDVIGFVIGVSEVGKRVYDKKTSYMQYVEIEDNRDNRIRLTVWGDEMLKRVADAVDSKNRIWIITSTIVKAEGVCSLSSSSATKILADEAIDVIQQFVTGFDMSKFDKPIEAIPLYNPFVSKREYEDGKKSIDEILKMIESGSEIPKSFFVEATISNIEEQNGWKYNSCTQCKRKVHLNEGRLRCGHCERDEPYPIMRETSVGDEELSLLYLFMGWEKA